MWLFPICLLLPLGIKYGTVSSVSYEILFKTLLSLLLISFLSLLLKKIKISLFCLWCASFLIGAFSIKTLTLAAKNGALISDNKEKLLLIRVSSFPEYKKDGLKATGKVLKIYDLKKEIYQPLRLIFNLDEKINITPGQCILLKLRCRDPGEYGIPGATSFRNDLAKRGIGSICKGNGKSAITEIHNCDRFYTPFLKATRGLIEKIIRKDFTQPESGFLLAITIGKTGAITENILKDFRNSGTAHLLAISGLHVGFIAGFLYFLFRSILKFSTRITLRYNIKRLSAIFTIPFVPGFALIAGMNPSTIRASVMIVFVLLSIGLLYAHNIMYIACSVWTLFLLFNPSALFDLSFELSFGALFSILLYAKYLKRIIAVNLNYQLLKRILQFLIANMFVSLTGFLGTFILIAKNFKAIPLYFLPANIIAVPLTGLIIPLLILHVLLSLLHMDISIFKITIDYLTRTLFLSNNFWASMPYAKIDCPPPDTLTCLLYYSVLLLFSSITSRWIKVPVLTFLLLYIPHTPEEIPETQRTELRLSFIDVGQGDATLLEFPDGKIILVDCGPAFDGFDAGERLIAPFLWDKGIKKVNVIAITHEQLDHSGGCNYIIEHFNVDEIWISDTNWDLSNIQVQQRKIKPGIVLEKNGIKVISINPGINREPWNNNNSLVLRIIYSKYSFILGADIEKIAEEKLQGDLKSTVLKVPHHGACTSLSSHFISRVSPIVAVISAGRLNYFNHPCSETIAELKKYTERIFTTAHHGTITITTDGNVLCYSTYYKSDNGCL